MRPFFEDSHTNGISLLPVTVTIQGRDRRLRQLFCVWPGGRVPGGRAAPVIPHAARTPFFTQNNDQDRSQCRQGSRSCLGSHDSDPRVRRSGFLAGGCRGLPSFPEPRGFRFPSVEGLRRNALPHSHAVSLSA